MGIVYRVHKDSSSRNLNDPKLLNSLVRTGQQSPILAAPRYGFKRQERSTIAVLSSSGNRSPQSALGSESSAPDRVAAAAGGGGQGPARGAHTTSTGATAVLSLQAETGAHGRKPVILVCRANHCCQSACEHCNFQRRAGGDSSSRADGKEKKGKAEHRGHGKPLPEPLEYRQVVFDFGESRRQCQHCQTRPCKRSGKMSASSWSLFLLLCRSLAARPAE